MSQTIVLPRPEVGGPETGGGRFMVTIFNNDTTSVDVVISTLMFATGCDAHEATMETWEAHHFGKAPVHFANDHECKEIASKIERAGIKAEVTPEWND